MSQVSLVGNSKSYTCTPCTLRALCTQRVKHLPVMLVLFKLNPSNRMSRIYCWFVSIKVNTISGLISQKYNASISFFEIPPAGAMANDGTKLLWCWATAISVSFKNHPRFRAQRATWINLLWVSQLPCLLKQITNYRLLFLRGKWELPSLYPAQ